MIARWLRTAGCLAAIEIVGLLGFVLVAKYFGGYGRFVPALLAIIAVGVVVYANARTMSRKEVVYTAITASITLVLFAQLLGHTVFPGLAKDMDLFSGSNAMAAVTLTAVAFSAHIVGLVLARMVRTSPR